MAVPNTTTFTLQNVVDEIAGTQTSLIACFADADPAGFDPLYEGSKNSLLNFRNYTDTPANVSIAPTNLNFSSAASSQNITVTVVGGEAWTAADDQTWMNLTGTTSSSASGTTTVNVNTNTSGFTRFGTVTFTWSGTNRTCTITQNA
tara:strand:- start:532 stop:972 length:441 start_codon:yes stop_codon:yes gene_type:complete